MENKEVYVFIQDNMAVGGIESYVYKSIKLLKKTGAEVIWIKSYRAVIDDVFRDELFDGSVTVWNKLFPSRLAGFLKRHQAIRCDIISFDVFRFAEADRVKGKLSSLDCDIHTYYFIPHFEGDSLFLERIFSNSYLKEQFRRKMATIFSKMNQNNNIRYFSKRHITEATETYNYTPPEADLIVPICERLPEFNRDNVKRLYYSDVFNILSVSRFEFPHKGFLIGLIEEYAKLKPLYPRLKLTIVGYGDGEKKIKDTISRYDDFIKNSIELVGRVSPDKLSQYYLNANLNISVAGSCTLGAKQGVLSLPARHYVYDCEVYGFMPESADFRVSVQPGLPVSEFIEAALKMSFDEYYQQCEKSYMFCLKNQNNISYTDLTNNSLVASINTADYAMIMILKVYRRVKHLVIRLIKGLKK